MLKEIIVGIAKALGNTFGPEYQVYDDDLTQGLEEPCFFIAVDGPSTGTAPPVLMMAGQKGKLIMTSYRVIAMAKGARIDQVFDLEESAIEFAERVHAKGYHVKIIEQRIIKEYPT